MRKRGSPRSRACKGGYVAAAIIVLLFACSDNGVTHDDDNFRDDVMKCEEALAHLADCCPAFDPEKVRCQFDFYRREGCSNEVVEQSEERPTLDPTESRCIRDMDCSEIVAHDVCTRTQNDVPYTRGRGADAQAPRIPVCP